MPTNSKPVKNVPTQNVIRSVAVNTLLLNGQPLSYYMCAGCSWTCLSNCVGGCLSQCSACGGSCINVCGASCTGTNVT